MPGEISWIDIPTTDADASAAFYEAVFGWKIIRDPNFGGYVMWASGEGAPSGGFDPQLEPTKAGPLLYLDVEDIDAALVAVGEAGGSKIDGKTLIHESVGWWGSFADPSGNRVGLYQGAQQG